MPYKLRGNCVIKALGGATVKCHPNQDAAMRHLAALEAATADEHTAMPVETPEVTVQASDGAKKALHILGAPYGGPNDGRDSRNLFFSSTTNFMLDYPPYTPTVWYNHGTVYDGANRTPLGIANRRWLNQQGLWFEFLLDPANELHNRLWDEALQGNLYASSGVVPASKIVEENGHIAQWHVGEVSVLPLNREQGYAPVNMYAVALPQVLSMVQSMAAKEAGVFAGFYGGTMSWFDELKRSLETVMAMLDRMPMTDVNCGDCGGGGGGGEGRGMERQPMVLSQPTVPQPDPALTALQERIAQLDRVVYQQQDTAWINGVLATGQLTQAEVPNVLSMLNSARTLNQGSLVDQIMTMVQSRPVASPPAGGSLLGFDAQQRVNGNGVETPTTPDYLNRLRHAARMTDGMGGQ